MKRATVRTRSRTKPKPDRRNRLWTSIGQRLYRGEPGRIWEFLRRQPASYWLISLYLFFEYVRPQQIYSSIEGWPLSQWTLILCLIAVCAEGVKLRRWTIADTGLVAFAGIVLLSSIVAWSPGRSFSHWKVFFVWLLVYFLITNIVKTERRFFVFILGFLLWSFKMSQHGFRSWMQAGFGWRDWGVTCGPGFFHDSGECGIQMAIFAPISLLFILALKPYWKNWMVWLFALMPFTAIVAIVGSSSRGAVLSLAAVGLWFLMKSRRRLETLVVIIVLGVATWAILPEHQKQRFSTMGEDATSQSRLDYWEDAIDIMNNHPVLGVGYENWLPFYRNNYDPYGQVVHNVFLQAGAELGYSGLFAFLFLIFCTLYLNKKTRTLSRRLNGDGRFPMFMAHGLDAALIAFLVGGTFVTVLYYPFFWINLAMTVSLYVATCNRLEAGHYRLRRCSSASPGNRNVVRAPSRVKPQSSHAT